MLMFRGKKAFIHIVLAATILLGGCQVKEEATEGRTIQNTPAPEPGNYEFLGEVELAWKDNSLDDWQAVINLPLKELKADGEQLGGAIRYFAGEGGAVRFKNHLVGSYKKNWSGVSGINVMGEEFAETITPDSDREGMQIDLLGPIAGENGYVAYWDERDENDEITGQWFYELSENYKKVWGIQAKDLFHVALTDIAGDNKGNYHVLLQEDGADDISYSILSHEGEKVFETTGSFSHGLRALEDGRVVVCEEVANDNKLEGQRLLEADIEKGILEEIASLSLYNVMNETAATEFMPLFVTAKGEHELVWCGKEGLYLCNTQGGETQLAYRWSSHGIALQEVKDVCAMANGTIGVIYKDTEGVSYLLLKPTQEKTEMKTITFAVSGFHKDAYASAVADFNKKYPAYNIEIKEDYEETSLLTQLGAGGGPVLIDTSITGFEELEKLWQPLDGYLEKVGLTEELLPQALDFGKIEGKTFGIVTNFYIRTLVVKEEKLKGWDYDEFLDAAEGFDGSVFTYDYINEPTDYRKTFFNILSNGMEDTLYVDLESGTQIFGTKDFERILRIAEKARKCPPSDNGKALQNGEVLCEIVNVSGAGGLVQLRTRLENGDFVTGYPTKNGARYLLAAQSPITVRSTATDEEKQMAYTFLKMLLSRDSAMESVNGNVNALYSVRKDILKEQFDYYERELSRGDTEGVTNRMPKLDREKEEALFEELLNNSIVQKAFPIGLQDIFDEEFDDYLEGQIPGDMLEDHLKSRVGLYMEENK